MPDVFVVRDCDPGLRQAYKIWEEPAPPQVVFEITSLSSKREDTVFKPRVYDEIGVSEYFVYNPTADYVRPPLRGFRRTDDGFCDIEPDADGWLVSESLGLKPRLEGIVLTLRDAVTGEEQLTGAASEHHARDRSRLLAKPSKRPVRRRRLKSSGSVIACGN